MTVGDEEGVFGLDDDEVIDSEEGDTAFGAGVEDDVVLGVDLGEVDVAAIFFADGFEVFRDGNPGSDVIPIEGCFDVEDAARFFHEGVVDGDRGEACEFLSDGGEDIGGGFELIDEVCELRGVLAEFLINGFDRPDEHAGVPCEVSLAEELLGELGVGLFAEAFDFDDFVCEIEIAHVGGGATLDVSVGGTSPSGFDSDGDEAVGAGSCGEGVF